MKLCQLFAGLAHLKRDALEDKITAISELQDLLARYR